MSETQTSVICPSCDEHFLIGVVDTDARAALVAAQKRIAELEAQHAALHNALHAMAQEWRDLADAFKPSVRSQYYAGKVEMLHSCADDLARTFDAALAGDEPAKE